MTTRDPASRPASTSVATVYSWNWATVLFAAFLINYGYFGARAPNLVQVYAHPIAAALQLILLGLIAGGFAVLAFRKPKGLSDSLRFKREDILVYLSYLAVLGALSIDRLRFSLFSDELFFSQQSVRHGLVVGLMAAKIAAIGSLPFRFIVQGISVVLLISLCFAWLFMRRLSLRAQVIVAVIVVMGSRAIITMVGGNLSPHPSLNLVPLFVAGSVFGVADSIFKLSYFVPYTVFIFGVYRLSARRCTPWVAWLTGLAVGTMPLLLHLGGIVEPSLWGAICLIAVFLDVLTADQPNYGRLMSVISLATLMRQPSIIAFVPVLLLMALDFRRPQETRSASIRRFAVVCVPLLLCLPFLLASLILGTPSTTMVTQGGAASRLFAALRSSIVATSISNSVSWWWIALIPFAFVPLARATIRRNALLVITAPVAVAMFYAINPLFFGAPKYQAEYAVPFAVAGLLCLVLLFGAHAPTRPMLPVLLVVLIGVNVVVFRRMPAGNRPVDELIDTMAADEKRLHGGYEMLCAFPFDVRDAYRDVKAAALSEHAYSMSYNYGVLPEIMNGYSARAIRSVNEIATSQAAQELQAGEAQGGDVSSPAERAERVDRDGRIRAVLLGFVQQKTDVIAELLERGWRVSGTYRNDRYGSTVVVAQRGMVDSLPTVRSR